MPYEPQIYLIKHKNVNGIIHMKLLITHIENNYAKFYSTKKSYSKVFHIILFLINLV